MTGVAPQSEFTSSSPEQTLDWGVRVGNSLLGGLTIGLCGPLGTGKTQLVKGIAAGNGQALGNRVTSPTFTLIQEYTGKFTLYHLDAYRLRGSRELLALGFEELVRADSVVVVEWADRALSALPEDRLVVTIEPGMGTERRLRLLANGTTALAFLANLTSGSG